MKKIYCNSSLAKVLLAWSSCHTITLGPFVFSKRDSSRLLQSIRNHECTHVRQWAEITIASWVVMLAALLICDMSQWWMLLSGVMFYVFYGVEYLVRLAQYRSNKKAYRAVSFEREANDHENDAHYLENCGYFEWIKYL